MGTKIGKDERVAKIWHVRILPMSIPRKWTEGNRSAISITLKAGENGSQLPGIIEQR